MSEQRSPEELLAELGRSVIPMEEHDVVEERRARVVSRIARTIRTTSEARTRTRRRARIFGALAAAAAVVVLLFGAAHFSSTSAPTEVAASVHGVAEGVVVSHAGSSAVVASGSEQRLGSGDELSTLAAAEAKLELDSGAVVQLAKSTHLTLQHVGSRPEVIHLALGRVSVRVPHLGPKGRFVVTTPDAEVTVHGTAFSVEVTPAGTRVEVSEGEVGVRHGSEHVVLHPGDSWTSSAKSAAKTDIKAAPVSASPAAKKLPAAVAKTPKPKTPPSKPASKPAQGGVAAALGGSAADQQKNQTDLPEQNRLFSAAVAARKSGNDARALGLLDQLLSRYPNGPLAPEARVERFRCLASMGRKNEAAKEARRYLLEHGDGAARDEARAVAIPDGN
jgi:ferric-dicitrate binding protein FerR (iron transport regulator)